MTGTPTDPIIAMSADPAQIARDVRASLAYYGRTDDAYWISLCDHPGGPFSNGKWYHGWNRYWELRADPSNTGSADPNEAANPAIHRAIPPPSAAPVDEPVRPIPGVPVASSPRLVVAASRPIRKSRVTIKTVSTVIGVVVGMVSWFWKRRKG